MDELAAFLLKELTKPYLVLMCAYMYWKRKKGLRQSVQAVIDSGSGVHLSEHSSVEDKSLRFRVTGFNGSQSLTDGSGALLCCVYDDTGTLVPLSTPNFQHMSGPRTIFSLGLLILAGFKFYLLGPKDNVMVTPCGKRIPLSLGDDNILVLDCMPWTQECNYGDKRVMHSATKPILHGIFNHCSDDKLRRTLEHTEGLACTGSKADTYCESCAKAKIRKRGLHTPTRSAWASRAKTYVSPMTRTR